MMIQPDQRIYHIESRYPSDSAVITALTKGMPGGETNTFGDIRIAAGVCYDIRRYLSDSRARLVDDTGCAVPEAEWLPALSEFRGGLRVRR